jgi:cytidylate kinase
MINTTSDRFVEALARLQQRAASMSKPRSSRAPLSIALSRQAGSRGAEVARAVGARLGWPVYDDELLRRISAEKGLQARLLEQVDERHMNWLEEMVASLYMEGTGSETGYLRSLMELFAALGDAGHCIIVGRGSAQVLPAATTLRVRVIAPHAERVVEIERRRQLSRAEAEKWVDRTDRERKQFIEHYFRKDPEEPLAYDLVLNSSRLGIDTCAELIARSAQVLDALA